MKNRLLVCLLIFGWSFSTYAQKLVGAYHGTLISDNNLLMIEEGDKLLVVKIFVSEKESIKVFGEYSNGILTFPLPQNEGEDLVVKAKLNSDLRILNIEFEIDEKKYQTDFEKIESPKKNLVQAWFQKDTQDLDPRIIGQWVHYLTTDSLGEIHKDNILAEMRSTDSFLENGVLIQDVQVYKEMFKYYGYKGTFDYASIPKASWFTTSDEKLTMKIGSDIVEYKYEISGDSLKLKSDVGSLIYYVKKNK